ncbi:MAG TPA: hypothetical protein VM266_11470 [Solirubrobacteraceae bacterium]|nr:hypothetical protein [Solirubrobacteraceae bacterium]
MVRDSERGSRPPAAGGPADALKEAVERTFQGAAGGAAGAQRRAQDLFDDVTSALQRLRESVDDRSAAEAVEQLREEVRALSDRVAALERAAAKPTTTKSKTTATRS